MPGPYDGVREASQYLPDQGVPREYRRQALQSFVQERTAAKRAILRI